MSETNRYADLVCKVNLLAHGDPAKVNRAKVAAEVCEGLAVYEREREVRTAPPASVRGYVVRWTPPSLGFPSTRSCSSLTDAIAAWCGQHSRYPSTAPRIFAVAEDGTETPLPSYAEALDALTELGAALTAAAVSLGQEVPEDAGPEAIAAALRRGVEVFSTGFAWVQRTLAEAVAEAGGTPSPHADELTKQVAEMVREHGGALDRTLAVPNEDELAASAGEAGIVPLKGRMGGSRRVIRLGFERGCFSIDLPPQARGQAWTDDDEGSDEL